MIPTFVRPTRFTGPGNRFAAEYQALDTPNLRLVVPGNPAAGFDEQRHVVQCDDGAIIEIGQSRTCGGPNSVLYHVGGRTWDLLHHDDGGKQTADVPGRFRHEFADGRKIEINPTFRGFGAAIPQIGAGIGIGRDQAFWLDGKLYLASHRHPADYDPKNDEDKNYGSWLIGARPLDTQVLYLRMPTTVEDVITPNAELCHEHIMSVHYLDGTPDDVAKVAMAVASTGWYAPDYFHGGATLLDLANAARREIDAAEWLGKSHHGWNGVWAGDRARIDYLERGKPAAKQDPVWRSGHAGVLIYTGGRSMALGFYAQVETPAPGEPIRAANALLLKTNRNPSVVTDSTDLQTVNSSVGIVVSARNDVRIPAGHRVTLRYWWTFGTPAQVERRLRNQAGQ